MPVSGSINNQCVCLPFPEMVELLELEDGFQAVGFMLLKGSIICPINVQGKWLQGSLPLRFTGFQSYT